MNLNSNKNIQKVIKYTFLLGLFLVVLGTSYALFTVTLTGRKKARIKTANFGLALTDINGNEETDGIALNLENAIPETDKEGLSRDGYKFVVTNTGNIPASYELKLNSTGTLSEDYIKYSLIEKDYLKKDDGTYYNGGIYSSQANSSVLSNNGISPLLSSISNNKLDGTTLLPGEKIEYELKLWIAYDATAEQVSGKEYESKVIIDGHQAEVYKTGKTGDTANYTLYKDGTMAITGTGEIKTVVLNDEEKTVGFYNNGGPINDIMFDYLGSKGHNINFPNNMVVSANNLDRSYYCSCQIGWIYASLSFMGASKEDFSLSDAEIDGLFNDGMFSSVPCALGDVSNKEAYDALLEILDFPIKLNRYVIDEGITSIKNGWSSAAFMGNGMLTLPSTLEDLGIYVDQGWQEFGSYQGYGLIVPSNIKVLDANRNISEELQYLDLNKVEEIKFLRVGSSHLNIPNTVKNIHKNGIYVYKDMVIDIDNTREYVEEHWDADWLKTNGYNVTVNYLRK